MSRVGYFASRRRWCGILGMCVWCRKRPAAPKRSKCGPCASRQTAYMRSRRAVRLPGMCTNCVSRAAEPGRRHCRLCVDAKKHLCRVRAEQFRRTMRCVYCGRLRPPGDPNFTCPLCAERRAFHRLLRD